MKRADQQRIRELLKGRTIKSVVVSHQSVTLELSDRANTKVMFSMEGAPGLDSNWYDWFVVRQNGLIIYRG